MKYTYKHTMKACYLGYITQAIINNLAPLLFIIFQDAFSISFEMIGRLILINFGTQIIADIMAVKFVDKIGYRISAVLAHVLCAVGLIALGILPNVLQNPYLGLVIAVMIYALGGGLIEVLVSPIVEALPGDAKESAMSLLHSFYCWGQVGVVLITTLVIKIVGTQIWPLLPIMWSLIPIYNLFKFMKVPLVPLVHEEDKLPLKALLSTNVFWIALLLMMCAGASELTMSQWSSLFAEKGLQVPKMIGDLLGPCLFAVLMGIGRTIYGLWGDRIELTKALSFSGILCVACYGITIFSKNPFISLLGCAVCGLSVSLMWPGTFSLTAKAFPRGGTMMFGVMAIFGDIGAAIGPWSAGVVSDLAQKSQALLKASPNIAPEQLGLKIGLLVAIIFPLLMVIGTLSFKYINNKILGTREI
ncbi:MAG: sugar MFS transporter [Cellulosilyticaceae bacterium]